ncbi:MAG: type I restriction enzyme subunit R domain-containing protein, partial [Nostoc sp.]
STDVSSRSHSRDKLNEFIADYNQMYQTQHSAKDSQAFYAYYKDIAKRMKEPLRETVLSACNKKPKLLGRKKIFARVVSKLLDIINKFDDALGELGEEE